MASSTSFIPYLCVAVAAFVTTFLTVPLVKRLAIKLDAVDYPSKRRINTKPIPRMGGTAVFLGLVIACIVQIMGTWYLGWPPVLVPHPRLHISYPVLALSFTVIFATGAIDDVFQLKPKQKLAGQVLAALIACMGGLRIGVIVNPFAPGEIMLGWLAYPITVIYLVAFTNIINLIDGLDGLATGICGIASFTMFTMAMLSGRIDAAALSIALFGSCVAFLHYNRTGRQGPHPPPSDPRGLQPKAGRAAHLRLVHHAFGRRRHDQSGRGAHARAHLCRARHWLGCLRQAPAPV